MPGKFDNSVISRIQQATDIVDLVSEHLSLERKGKEFVGLCPFHADHRPSMYVSPAKQLFKCFACGAGGDAFKFVQMRENLSFPEAIERLAGRAGIKYEARRRRRPAGNSSSSSSQGDPKLVARVNAWAQKLWRENLLDEQKGTDARNYVASRRISEEAVKQWGMGLAPEGWDNLVKAARERNIADSLLLEAGLAVSREGGGLYDKFRNRLMFPIMDVSGRVIGFGGRTLGDDPAKYMNSPATVLFDKSNSLYGLDEARHEVASSGTAVVVEGYTDVIMAHQFGCTNVVAALGTSFTAGHAIVLRRYAKRIVLVFDSDVAGMEAANRALEVCLAQRIDIKLAFAGEGRDPCDFLLSEGKEGFDRLIENATDVMEYKWQRLRAGLSESDNMTDRRRVTEEYLRSVATAMQSGKLDSLTEGMIVNKLSGLTGMSQRQIKDEIKRLQKRPNRTEVFVEPDQQVRSVGFGKGAYAEAQQEVLEVLLNEPGLFEKMAARIPSGHFEVEVLRKIAEALFDLLERGDRPELRDVLTMVESAEGAKVLMDLAERGARKGNYEVRLADAVETIERHFQSLSKRRMREGLSDDDTEGLRRYDEMIRNGGKGQRSPGLLRR